MSAAVPDGRRARGGSPGARQPAITTADELHRRLRVRICAGDFMPGQTISIRRLAEEYGTSVIPARDAVRWLVAEGALEFADRRRIIVPAPDAARYRDILFARRALETEAAARAFPAIGPTERAELAAIDAAIDRALAAADFTGYMTGNYRFHFAIYRRARAPVLLHLIELLWLQFGPSMRFICSRLGTHRLAQDFHREALAALAAGDADAFRAAIGADIAQGIELLLES